jgi:RHS repeat-associated protein
LRSHGYAADRRRITIRGADGTETVRVWDRATVIAEYETAEGAPLRASRELVYLGPRLLCTYDAVDDASPDADAGAAVIHYHHPDRLSTRLVTAPRTSVGDAVEAPDVDILSLPYGTRLQPGPTSPIDSVFAGYRRDLATGLDDAVNRDYDPRLSRFITPDPIAPAGMRAERPQTANAYAYGAGDPVNALDPLGLIDIPWLIRWNEGGRRQEWDPVQRVWVETIEVRAPGRVSQAELSALARQVQETQRAERRGGGAGRGGGTQPRQQSCREMLTDIVGNPEMFMWGSVDGNRHLGGPVKISGETIGLAGINLTGPYYGAISAVGIEVEAGGAHGALLGGVEGITQHDWARGPAQHELGPIGLLELGTELGNYEFVGGLYSHHLTTTGSGMYVGMSFGPLSVGVGSNWDAGLALVVYRAMKYVLNPNRPRCTP